LNICFPSVSSGTKGSSVKRLQEAKQRSFYYKVCIFKHHCVHIEILGKIPV
jgi:hypothetical protein